MSLTATIKSIQDIMRKDMGVDGDAQRIGQLGWMLFYKIFSDQDAELEINDDDYNSPIPLDLRWDEWADSTKLGKNAPTGQELLDLIDQLFKRFKALDGDELEGIAKQRALLLRSVFEDAYNYMKSGTLLRQVVDKINESIDFNQSKMRHLFGDLYKQILKDLQSAGNAGEFYTPRAATQFNVRHDNTLRKPLQEYGHGDQVDIVMTNPPFGGMEEDGIERGFPNEFQTRETADLFLVLVMELLKQGGRAPIEHLRA